MAGAHGAESTKSEAGQGGRAEQIKTYFYCCNRCMYAHQVILLLYCLGKAGILPMEKK